MPAGVPVGHYFGSAPLCAIRTCTARVSEAIPIVIGHRVAARREGVEVEPGTRATAIVSRA